MSLPAEELLRQLVKKTSAKTIAAHLGLKENSVHKWMEVSQGGATSNGNPLARVAGIIEVTKDDGVIQWLCEQADGFFVKNSRADNVSRKAMVLEVVLPLMKKFARNLDAIATTAGDSRITEKESKALRKRWDEMKSIMEAYVRDCEKGQYDGGDEAAGERG